MHERYPDHDKAVTEWFRAKGWSVTKRHWDFGREVFAWRDEVVRPEITLRITLRVVEDVPANKLGPLLDRLLVESRLKASPERYTIVKEVNSRVVVEQLDGPPP